MTNSQNLVFKRGVNFTNIELKEGLQEIRVDSLIIERGGQGLMRDKVIYANHVVMRGWKSKLRLEGSYIFWRESCNADSSMVIPLEGNRVASSIIPYIEGKFTLKKNGKVIHLSDYKPLKSMYISQGVYEVYQKGVLIEFIIFDK